jgi:hypothetical protein
MLRQTNTRRQGDIGMGDAIAWFSRNGYTIAIPLTDSQKYDLIAERSTESGSMCYRIQIKTTTQDRDGVPTVQLKTSGGNKTRLSSTAFDASECDLLYVLSEVDDVTRRHLIPTAVIQCTNQLNLGKKYAAYELQPAPTNR